MTHSAAPPFASLAGCRLAAPARAARRHTPALCLIVALLLAGCAHRPDPQTPTRAATAPDATLQAGAERAVLDAAAFDAARQRTPAPPRTEPQQVAKPVPSPAPRRLSVPFGIGSTRLTADQAAALQQLGKGADRGQHWRVTAHVDAVGAPANTRRLARARADRVVEQLVRAGVRHDAISIVEIQATPTEAGNPQQTRRVDVETIEG